jgi:hypothetical protein
VMLFARIFISPTPVIVSCLFATTSDFGGCRTSRRGCSRRASAHTDRPPGSRTGAARPRGLRAWRSSGGRGETGRNDI